MQHKIIKISAILCLGMFIYFIIRANPGELLRIIGRLSPIGIMLLIALRFLFWIIRTISWRLVLTRCSSDHVSFSTLFWAELAGHAMGYFTPSAKLGGDAIRAMMLSPVPKNQALASVVIDKTIELIATILMMSLGLFITLVRIRMAATQRIVFLSLTALMALFIFVLFRKQKKGLFIWILDTLKKLRIKSKYFELKRERLIETDKIIADFYSRHRRTFLNSFILYVSMVMLWVVEMHLSFLFLGMARNHAVEEFPDHHPGHRRQHRAGDPGRHRHLRSELPAHIRNFQDPLEIRHRGHFTAATAEPAPGSHRSHTHAADEITPVRPIGRSRRSSILPPW